MKETTAGQLIEFLKQYPEDSKIKVLHEVQGAWSIYTELDNLDLEKVEVVDYRESDYIPEEAELFNTVVIHLL